MSRPPIRTVRTVRTGRDPALDRWDAARDPEPVIEIVVLFILGTAAAGALVILGLCL